MQVYEPDPYTLTSLGEGQRKEIFLLVHMDTWAEARKVWS